MFKISATYFKSAVCLYLRIVSGIVGVELRSSYVRSTSTCSSISTDDILGNGRVTGKNSLVS